MNWVAWKMLNGDRTKYIGIVFGVAFGSLLIAHQTSVFVSVMRRTVSQILDVSDADIWVMNEHIQSVDEIRPIPENEIDVVRGVTGVDWAVGMYKGMVTARQPNGRHRQLILIGLDDQSLVGAPRQMVLGDLANLRRPDAVMIDQAGYTYLYPNQARRLGDEMEINDHRAVIVGVCRASPPFQTFPVMFARLSVARKLAPVDRNFLSFVMVKAKPGVAPEELCQRIQERTGRLALTTNQFAWRTIEYYLKSTGIPINFGITVALGFIVGTAIAGQTFYLFTIENLKQFGNLKAMGVTNARLIQMILLQGLVVGGLGYGIGMGMSAGFFEATKDITHLAGFFMPWQVAMMTALAVGMIVAMASIVSIRRVLVLEPAAVFR